MIFIINHIQVTSTRQALPSHDEPEAQSCRRRELDASARVGGKLRLAAADCRLPQANIPTVRSEILYESRALLRICNE